MQVARRIALLAALIAAPADAGTEQTLTPTVLVTRSPTDPPTPKPTDSPTYSPTYSPTECVCEDQMWKYDEDSDQCVRGCGVEGNAYTSRNRCCNLNFGGTGDVCDDWDMCAPPTPEPTPEPTPRPTPSPTPEPTPCVCEDQMWTYDGGADECVRGCGVAGNGAAYPNENRCCNLIFGVGSLAGGACNSYDMCAPPTPAPTPRPTPSPSPQPTSGSTPTVGTETTVPPTVGNQKVICASEAACEATTAAQGLTPFSVDANQSFPARGCFKKNGKGFYSPGTAEEEAATDLGGTRVRVYCSTAAVSSQVSNVESLDYARKPEESAGPAARAGVAAAAVGAVALLF